MAEEKEKKNSHGEGCMCSTCSGSGMMGMACNCGCRHGGHWPFYLLRVLITLIILMMVFAFGAAIGRLTANVGYGRYQMMRYGGGYAYPAGMMGGSGVPMMRINGATSTPPATGGVQNY